MNTIEEKLWNYIDGSCSIEEQQAIGLLIKQDETYRLKYQELLKLSNEFATMELDEPPMAFTYNVMEGIRTEYAQTPLKAAIDKRIIRGISIFFIVTISAILLLAFSSINWSANDVAVHAPSKFAFPDLKGLLSGAIGKGFLFLDTVLALFLLDSYLRKQGLAKADINVQNGGQQKQQQQ